MTGMAIAGITAAALATAAGGYMTYQNNKEAASIANAQGQAQAKIYAKQAEVAQQQGEKEAERRSKILAQDIGSAYSNYAANGLLVDGTSGGTLGDVLKTTRQEANDDISTINENTANNVWTYKANEAYTRSSARMQAAALKRQSKLGLLQTFTGLPLTSSNGFGMGMSSASDLNTAIAKRNGRV